MSCKPWLHQRSYFVEERDDISSCEELLDRINQASLAQAPRKIETENGIIYQKGSHRHSLLKSVGEGVRQVKIKRGFYYDSYRAIFLPLLNLNDINWLVVTCLPEENKFNIKYTISTLFDWIFVFAVFTLHGLILLFAYILLDAPLTVLMLGLGGFVLFDIIVLFLLVSFRIYKVRKIMVNAIENREFSPND